jgi:hypothetical protein
MAGPQSEALMVCSISGTGITGWFIYADHLFTALCKFANLKHIDFSDNPGLKLLPVRFLHMAARLETFNCDSCHLMLPPQSFFCPEPDQNPSRIQDLLARRVCMQSLSLCGAGLLLGDVPCVAELLDLFPALDNFDLSANMSLGLDGVKAILHSFSGM